MDVITNQEAWIRAPWGQDGFKVLSHVFWRSDAQRVAHAAGVSEATLNLHHNLNENPMLKDAAERGNAAAAEKMVDAMYNRQAVDKLRALLNGALPIIVAPHVPKEQAGRNLLDVAFADRLADDLNGETSEIFQEKRMGRHGLSGLARVLIQPRFHGAVEAGKPYIIADDQISTGGTLAALRGYIENRGGRVLAATALANGNGSTTRERDATTFANVESRLNFNLASDRQTVDEIKAFTGDWFESFIQRRIGFPADRLTRFEADCLASQCRSSSFRNTLLGQAARLQPASA